VGDYGTEVYQVDASAVTDTVYNIPELGAMKPGVMNGLPVIYSAGDGVDCSMNSKLVFFYDDKQLHLIDPHFTQETGEGDDVPANATYGYTHLETTHDPITIEQDEQGIRLVWIQSPRTWMRVEWKDNKLNSGDVVDEEAVAREAAVKTSEASWKFLGFSDDLLTAGLSIVKTSGEVVMVGRFSDGEIMGADLSQPPDTHEYMIFAGDITNFVGKVR
jgi:hypothetical protein